jgi:hypothetical protein|eukprot:31089-Pelagococcus_subviridis.AAC.20
MAPKKETKNALVVERLHVILADADLETMTVKNVQAKLESELKTDIERGFVREQVIALPLIDLAPRLHRVRRRGRLTTPRGRPRGAQFTQFTRSRAPNIRSPR